MKLFSDYKNLPREDVEQLARDWRTVAFILSGLILALGVALCFVVKLLTHPPPEWF